MNGPIAIQAIPPVMTTQEAAAVLRCDVTTLERYVYTGQLAAIQIGRERRIRGEAVSYTHLTLPTIHSA